MLGGVIAFDEISSASVEVSARLIGEVRLDMALVEGAIVSNDIGLVPGLAMALVVPSTDDSRM